MNDVLIKQALNTLNRLERTSGRKRNERLALLKENAGNPYLKSIFAIAYDWRVSYPTPPTLPKRACHAKRTLEASFDEFQRIVQALMTRTIVGGLAREIVKNSFITAAPPLRKWLYRALGRDLRCGVSLRILSKVWPEFDLRFGYAYPAHGTGGSLKVPKLLASWPLLRGQRVLVVVRNGGATAYTDGFRAVPLMERIGRELARAADGDAVFDGVLTAPTWTDTDRLLHSKLKSISALELRQFVSQLRFVITEVCSIEVFNASSGHCDPTPFSARRMTLELLYQRIKRRNPKSAIRLAKVRIIRDTADLAQAHYHYSQLGYLGMALKPFDGAYVAGPDPALIELRFKRKQQPTQPIPTMSNEPIIRDGAV